MLPYQEDRKLEKLLESLFGDDSDDVEVLWLPIGPYSSTACCSLSYANYSA
jgi:hypothetical protein